MKALITEPQQHQQRQGPPELPLELWAHIVGFITDPRYLPRAWLYFRLVSRTFRAATEMAFVARHLPHAELVFNRELGYRWPPSPSGRSVHYHQDPGPGPDAKDDHDRFVFPSKTIFQFDRLHDGGTRAVFVRKYPDEWLRKMRAYGGDCDGDAHNNLFDLSISGWRAALEPYSSSPSSPPSSSPSSQRQQPNQQEQMWTPVHEDYHSRQIHMLALRRVAYDTALPGLEVDFERHEISLLWQPALSLLFGEEEYVKWAKKVDYQHSTLRASSGILAALVRVGEMDYEEYEQVVFSFVTRRDRRVPNAVRRARLERHGRHDGGGGDGKTTGSSSKSWSEDLLKSSAVATMREDKEARAIADEFVFPGEEECKGNFYDGMGMKFMGKGETNRLGEHEFVPELFDGRGGVRALCGIVLGDPRVS